MKLLTTLYWHSSQTLLFLKKVAFVGFYIMLAHSAQAQTTQQQIIGTSQAFLEDITAQHLQSNNITARYSAKIGRLDPRLRLPSCSIPLQASLESPAQPIGRVTIRVRCDSDAPWTIFVPGHVNLYREIAVAVRSLQRSSIIQATDVQLAERDVSSLRQGYILDLDNVIGYQLLRPVQPDSVISTQHIKAAAAISKGDEVVISASAGAMSVRMPGTALEDGAMGQQIRVRNNRSKRVVHARVVAPGRVEVAM